MRRTDPGAPFCAAEPPGADPGGAAACARRALAPCAAHTPRSPRCVHAPCACVLRSSEDEDEIEMEAPPPPPPLAPKPPHVPFARPSADKRAPEGPPAAEKLARSPSFDAKALKRSPSSEKAPTTALKRSLSSERVLKRSPSSEKAPRRPLGATRFSTRSSAWLFGHTEE